MNFIAVASDSTGGRPRVRPLGLLVRIAGQPALARALPVYAGIAIVGGVIFGPSGMSAADVTGLMEASAVARLCLWAAWLLGISPAVVAAARAEQGFYLRALPIGLASHLAAPFALGLLLQAPWAWLLLRGEGAVAAAAGTLAAAAAAALVAIRPRHWRDSAARAVLLAGLAGALWWPIEPLILGASGLVVYLLAVPAAWVRAPERGSRRPLLRVGGPAPIALGGSAMAYLARRRRSALARAAIWTAAGGAATALAAVANDLAGPPLGALVVGAGALAMAAALGGAAAAVVEHERAARWLLDTTGAGGGVRVAAAAAPLVALGILCGAGFGGVVAFAAGGSPSAWVRCVGYAVASGAAWALVALAVARACERPAGVDGTRVLVVLLGLALAVAVGAALLGQSALLGLVALAIGTALISSDRGKP